MNAKPNPADFALALYAGACESHQRKDWRQACHALADALRSELMRTTAIAAPPAPVVAPAPVKRTSTPKAAAYAMTAESLTTVLRFLKRASPSGRGRHTIPILMHVLIEAGRDVVTLRTTDMDRELFVRIDAPGCGEWSATADLAKLSGLLTKAKGPVTFAGELDAPHSRKSANGTMEDVRNSRLIVSGAVNAKLSGLVPSDFPRLLKPETVLQSVKVAAADLADALAFVQPAISSEATRYYLNGAYVHGCVDTGRSTLRVVATDGNRLHATAIERGEGEGLAESGVIIPMATVGDMLAAIGANAGPFDFSASESYVQLVKGPVVVTSRVIDGNFPDYTRVIPATDSGKSAVFNAADLCSALAKVTAISDSREPAATINLEGSAAAVSCRSADSATSSETIECDWSGDACEITFRGAFLAMAAKSLGSERVKATLGGPNDPVRLEALDEGDFMRLAVFMTMRR